MISMPMSYSWNSTLGGYNLDDNPLIPNPHNTTGDSLLDMKKYCVGALGGDQVNISRLDIGLGFVAGPAVMLNQSDPSNTSSTATWERPYYVCSGATRLSIKTLRFRYNGTKEPALNDMEILGIEDKKYSSEGEMPIWGFETARWNATTTWNLSSIDPLWGIVSSADPSNKDVTTIQAEGFYLPASYQTTDSFGWELVNNYRDYTPGTSGPSVAWRKVLPASLDSFDKDPYTDNDLEKQRFITSMMANATSTSRLMRLMWTDMASNLLVGTRGLHEARYQPTQSQRLGRRDDLTGLESLPDGQYPVYQRVRRIRYHWVYGIPAFICMILIMAVLMVALLAILCGRATVTRLKWYMFNTSSGRLLASFAYPDVGSDKSIETKEWLERVGKRPVMVSGYSTGIEMKPGWIPGKGPQTYVRIDPAG